GELVDHNGRVAKSNVTGKAAKVLQYLMNVKPNFFRCEPIIIIVPPDLDDLIYGADGARVS
ncbi:MAG: hypothetical protein HPY74_18235, partial [Firmicutes bacterium]|nr:hypothetical protein [Bacillota bacterium]